MAIGLTRGSSDKKKSQGHQRMAKVNRVEVVEGMLAAVSEWMCVHAHSLGRGSQPPSK